MAAILGLQAQWHGRSAHPRLTDKDEEILSAWMASNLSTSFSLVKDVDAMAEIEDALRAELCPPFNRDGRTPEQLYVSAATTEANRNALRDKG